VELRRDLERRLAASEAQPPELPEAPSLDDYRRHAMLQNPGLQAAYQRVVAALERVPQATALPEPRLTYGYFIRKVETRVGPQRHRLGVMQAFPWFGTLRLRGVAALAGAEAAAQRLEATRLRLAYRVADPYCELHYLAQAVAITKENIELLRYIETVARSQYRVRGAPYADVIRAQVELSKLEDQLRSLEDLRQPLAARLNAALDRPADAPVPWPQDLPAGRLGAADPTVLAWLREASPELGALSAEIARQQAAVALARKGYYPGLSLGLSYIATGPALMPTPDSGKDPVMAELGLTLPIWRSKYRGAEREARARQRSAEHALAERSNTLAAEAKMALFRLRDAERRIVLYRDSLLPKAKQSLEATQTAYTASKASLTDYVDAERVLLAFRLAYERARADRAQRLAELEMLVGRPLAQEVPEAEPKQEKGAAPAP
jgi:outer membrane protein TolC